VGSSIHVKDDDIQTIWKDNAKVHLESSDTIVILRKEERQKYRTLLADHCKAAGWKQCEPVYKHHLLYDVGKGKK